jgi:hypothetical protein
MCSRPEGTSLSKHGGRPGRHCCSAPRSGHSRSTTGRAASRSACIDSCSAGRMRQSRARATRALVRVRSESHASTAAGACSPTRAATLARLRVDGLAASTPWSLTSAPPGRVAGVSLETATPQVLLRSGSGGASCSFSINPACRAEARSGLFTGSQVLHDYALKPMASRSCWPRFVDSEASRRDREGSTYYSRCCGDGTGAAPHWHRPGACSPRHLVYRRDRTNHGRAGLVG